MSGTRRCHRWSCTGGRWLFDKMLSDTLTPEPPEGSLMFSHVSAVRNTDVWCSFNHPHTQDRVQSNIQQGFRARAFPRLGLSDHMSPHTGEPGLLHTEHSHILYLHSSRQEGASENHQLTSGPHPSLEELHRSLCLRKARGQNPPGHALSELLSSGRRFRSLKTKTNGLKNSFTRTITAPNTA